MRIFLRTNPNLWTLITPPAVWALHFLVSYVAAAVYCAKAGEQAAGLGPVNAVVAVATGVALAAISAATWQAVRHWRPDSGAPPYGDDSADGRDQFLGYATLLLCGLSLVGVIFVALPALFVWDCR